MSDPNDFAGVPLDPTPVDPEGTPGLPELPTQIAFPLRTVLRGVVQSLVGLLLAWLARYGFEVTDPGITQAIVDVVTAAVWIAGTALTTWIMTRPGVAKVFLPPVPQRAL